jgi:SagB-type dehydrogenase family enzyme
MGQLLEVSKVFGFETGVYFQFLDRAMNHLLGLSESEETVYSVIPLSVEPTIWSANGSERDRIVSAAEMCQELTQIQPDHYVRTQRVKEYPMLTKLNEASMLDSTTLFTVIEAEENRKWEGQAVALPYAERLSYDLGSVCRKRFSPDMDFTLGKVSQFELANLLHEAMESFLYRNDLVAAHERHEPRVSLNVCLYNVEGIPNGAYHYDSTAHALHQAHPGDHRLLLQSGMSLNNVNLLQVPLCIHVTGVKDYYKNELGYRGYRIQQMEAGMLVQRLLLLAAASGMGGHPLLGYDSNLCDELYKLDHQEKTSLIQIPIGPYRNRPWLMGGLCS